MRWDKSKKSYTFGPVPSRRLGRSLGIDLVPFKTCTYDCVYCQLGRTTEKTISIKEYVPVKDVIQEVREKVREIPRPDYITLSGSGEPTLHGGIRDIIQQIKDVTDIPVAVLTNGSLFFMDMVRESVGYADLILPSLDAGSEDTFFRVNRPHSKISFEEMIEGLCSLRESFEGPLWLEILFVGGITDNVNEIEKIKELTDRILPERIQLNTAVRTPAEGFVYAVSREKLEVIANFFGPNCEVIADYAGTHGHKEFSSTRGEVLELLKRRPCSADDVCDGLGLHRNEAVKHIQELLDKKEIMTERRNNKILYFGRGNHLKGVLSQKQRDN
jgi:wyosine [tRNA(Phe)-imidazoG37] synthetase (radical SAM superfamily)